MGLLEQLNRQLQKYGSALSHVESPLSPPDPDHSRELQRVDLEAVIEESEVRNPLSIAPSLPPMTGSEVLSGQVEAAKYISFAFLLNHHQEHHQPPLYN